MDDFGKINSDYLSERFPEIYIALDLFKKIDSTEYWKSFINHKEFKDIFENYAAYFIITEILKEVGWAGCKKNFEAFLFFADSLINSDSCPQDLKNSIMIFRDQVIYFFFKRIKLRVNNYKKINPDFGLLIDELNILLKISDLDDNFMKEVKSYLDICNIRSKSTRVPLHSSSEIKETIKVYKYSGMSKSEMIDYLSKDFGISKDSALTTINSLYRDNELKLQKYFSYDIDLPDLI